MTDRDALDPELISTEGRASVTTRDGLVIPFRPTRMAADGRDGDAQVALRGWWISMQGEGEHVTAYLHQAGDDWVGAPLSEIVTLDAPCGECESLGRIDWLPWLKPGETEACVTCRGRGWMPCGLVGQEFAA